MTTKLPENNDRDVRSRNPLRQDQLCASGCQSHRATRATYGKKDVSVNKAATISAPVPAGAGV